MPSPHPVLVCNGRRHPNFIITIISTSTRRRYWGRRRQSCLHHISLRSKSQLPLHVSTTNTEPSHNPTLRSKISKERVQEQKPLCIQLANPSLLQPSSDAFLSTFPSGAGANLVTPPNPLNLQDFRARDVAITPTSISLEKKAVFLGSLLDSYDVQSCFPLKQRVRKGFSLPFSFPPLL